LVGRQELLPPGARVAARAAGEIRTEILDVDLDSRAVRGEQLDRHSAFLPDHSGLVALGGERDLYLTVFAVALVGIHRRRNEKTLRRLAGFDATDAAPATGVEVGAVPAADA